MENNNRDDIIRLAKVEWYEEVLQVEPHSKLFLPYARLLFELGKKEDNSILIEKAIKSLRNGLEIHQDYIEARLFLIEILHHGGHSDKCGVEVARLASLFVSYPDFWDAWRELTITESDNKDFSVALGFMGAMIKDESLTLRDIFNAGIAKINQSLTQEKPAQKKIIEDININEVGMVETNTTEHIDINENLADENLIVESLIEESPIEENFVNENIATESLIEESFIEEDLGSKNLVEESIVDENLIEEDLISENLVDENLVDKNLDTENLADESLIKKSFIEEDLINENSTEESIVDEKIVNEQAVATISPETNDSPDPINKDINDSEAKIENTPKIVKGNIITGVIDFSKLTNKKNKISPAKKNVPLISTQESSKKEEVIANTNTLAENIENNTPAPSANLKIDDSPVASYLPDELENTFNTDSSDNSSQEEHQNVKKDDFSPDDLELAQNNLAKSDTNEVINKLDAEFVAELDNEIMTELDNEPAENTEEDLSTPLIASEISSDTDEISFDEITTASDFIDESENTFNTDSSDIFDQKESQNVNTDDFNPEDLEFTQSNTDEVINELDKLDDEFELELDSDLRIEFDDAPTENIEENLFDVATPHEVTSDIGDISFDENITDSDTITELEDPFNTDSSDIFNAKEDPNVITDDFSSEELEFTQNNVAESTSDEVMAELEDEFIAELGEEIVENIEDDLYVPNTSLDQDENANDTSSKIYSDEFIENLTEDLIEDIAKELSIETEDLIEDIAKELSIDIEDEALTPDSTLEEESIQSDTDSLIEDENNIDLGSLDTFDETEMLDKELENLVVQDDNAIEPSDDDITLANKESEDNSILSSKDFPNDLKPVIVVEAVTLPNNNNSSKQQNSSPKEMLASLLSESDIIVEPMESSPFRTRSMAEVLAEQGNTGEAIEIYQELISKAKENNVQSEISELQEKIKALELGIDSESFVHEDVQNNQQQIKNSKPTHEVAKQEINEDIQPIKQEPPKQESGLKPQETMEVADKIEEKSNVKSTQKAVDLLNKLALRLEAKAS